MFCFLIHRIIDRSWYWVHLCFAMYKVWIQMGWHRDSQMHSHKMDDPNVNFTTAQVCTRDANHEWCCATCLNSTSAHFASLYVTPVSAEHACTPSEWVENVFGFDAHRSVYAKHTRALARALVRGWVCERYAVQKLHATERILPQARKPTY